MSKFALKTTLPSYLRDEQERIEDVARGYGLDFFPTVFEMLTYDQMNEVAAYGGFPTRYPHWRFGMEYEQLSKSYEYGLSKIYEMVINNNPSYAYLLEGNSLTEQKLVMCHVLGHVDFFKNNFAFRATDLDAGGQLVDPMRRKEPFDPQRKWIDKMANNGSRIRRHMDRWGVAKVEEFIDHCLSLENLIDPWRPFTPQREREEEADDATPAPVPKLRAKGYMDKYINPEEYLEEQRKKLAAEAEKHKGFPESPERDVLLFLLEHAPLERWERDCLEVIREESYYFVPQIQTKIMNEGWASYWHSRMMTEKVADATDILDYADRNAGVLATSGGRLNPYKLGVELFRNIEERWNKGQFGREWEDCDQIAEKRDWDLRLGKGREKVFEVRKLYNDLTFLDEFLTLEVAMDLKLFTFSYSNRSERFEIETREFKKVKEKLLFQLTNGGNPVIQVIDANYENRGELLLRHEHNGIDLKLDYAKECLRALHRIWRRPCCVATIVESKPSLLRYDGTEHTSRPYKVLSAAHEVMTQEPPRDPDHWLHRLSAREWIQAALGELSRAEAAYAINDARAGIAGAKRAAGMALNGALVVEPDDAWGRSYVDHVTALAKDGRVPEAARDAARELLTAKPPGGGVIGLRSRAGDERVLEAARTVMAHAYAVVVRHGG